MEKSVLCNVRLQIRRDFIANRVTLGRETGQRPVSCRKRTEV